MPTPKPASLRLIQGKSGHRPIPIEPAVVSEVPKPPSYLTAAARKEWKVTAPLLKGAGLISMQDREMFGRWCTLVAKIADYERQLEVAGPTTTAQSGYLMPHPLVAILNAAHKQLVSLSDRFCLNPRARMGAHVELKKEADAFETYLRRGLSGKEST